MAEETRVSIIAQQLATELHFRAGNEIPFETYMALQAIRDAEDLVNFVRANDLDAHLIGSATWVGLAEEVAAEGRAADIAADQRLSALKPPGYVAPGEPLSDREAAIVAENEAYEERLAKLEAAADVDLPTVIGFSSEKQAAEYMAVHGSDDYSPWGPLLSRSDVADLTIKYMNYERMQPGPEADYWREQMLSTGAYTIGDELFAWTGLSTETRARLEDKMERAGLLDYDQETGTPGYVPGSLGIAQISAMQQAMATANYLGVGFEVALDRLSADHQAAQRLAALRAARTQGGGSVFSIPASLRQIPDYPSISQEATNLFRQRMGRDPRDWEMALLADHMKEQYENRNAEMIKAARAAFYQAQGGGAGTLQVEVPDPQLRTQRFIEQQYGDEIDRYEQIGDTAVTNRLMLDAITTGGQLVGG